MDIVMVGPFGLTPKHTMRCRALPMAIALVERGHRVTMLLPPWPSSEAAGSSRNEGGVQIINLPLPPRAPLLFEIAVTIGLVRRAIGLRPHVVHCFKPKAYSGFVLLSLWLLRKLGLCRCRLVLDCDDWEGAGGWNDRERYAPFLKALFARQERWCLTHADAVSVASRTLESLAWSLGVSPAAVGYVPNGIATFPPGRRASNSADSASLDAPQTVLLYTRFVECSVGRVGRIICALRHRKPELRFLIAGTGMSGEEGVLAAQLKDCVPQSSISWLGWLSVEELERVFAQTTVAIYPMEDNLINRAKCSVKTTDLLGAGVALVAEAVGQMREYIQHGDSGWLANPGDDESLVDGVVRLLEDAPLRARLSAGALARMRAQFSWAHLVSSVDRLYGA